jgi:hypothetical protein
LTSLVLFALGSTVALRTFLPSTIFAQPEELPVTASWSLGNAPAEGWTIGDRIPIRLTVTYPANGRVTIPALPEMWGPFEVRQQQQRGPFGNNNETLSVILETTATLWAPGEHQTPRFAVHFRDGHDQLHKVSVPPLAVTVGSVLQDGDTAKRDLKPQASLPSPSVWPWILGAVFAATSTAIAGWVLFARLGRRTPLASTSVHPPAPRPAHEIAYGELCRIAALELPAQGEVKRHYSLVADCIREYVHTRYGIPAMDLTTEELAAALRQRQVDRSHSGLCYHLLAEADLVKFAEFRPSLGQASAAIDQARLVVDLTRIDKSADGQTDAPGGAARVPSHLPPKSEISPSDHDTDHDR